MVRRGYRLFGRVQNVGLRFTASHTARSLGLTGTIRNHYDGSVLMEVQGEKDTIAELIARLQDDLYIRIDYMEVEELELQPKEKRFRVEH